jgi:hypothetical protein
MNKLTSTRVIKCRILPNSSIGEFFYQTFFIKLKKINFSNSLPHHQYHAHEVQYLFHSNYYHIVYYMYLQLFLDMAKQQNKIYKNKRIRINHL